MQIFGTPVLEKSVESVLKAFKTAVKDLQDISKREDSRADSKLVDAAVLQSKAGDHRKEAQYAAAVAARLQALIS